MSAWLVDTRRVEIDRFEEVLRAVHERFPALTVKVIREHPHVDALAEIPRQAGLAFDVAINLQNLDELHLTVSHLWVEWFPCGEQHIFEPALGAEVHEPVKDVGGGIKVASVRDPFGNLFSIIENPHFRLEDVR